MPDSKAKRDWIKRNTVMLGIKLNRNTDADIIEWLDGKARQTEAKRLIRTGIAEERRKQTT